MFEQWAEKVGLENLLQVQPKQVTCLGVRDLVQALKGAQIHLFFSENCDSDTSELDTSHYSIPQGYFSADPLGLHTGGPSDLEDGEIFDRSHHSEPMDQSDTLGHGIHSAGGTASNASAAVGGMSDFQSKNMDTIA